MLSNEELLIVLRRQIDFNVEQKAGAIDFWPPFYHRVLPLAFLRLRQLYGIESLHLPAHPERSCHAHVGEEINTLYIVLH
jgi:hypothetical protein